MKKIIHFAHWVNNAVLLRKILLMMRITIFLLLVFTLQTLGIDSYSQSTKLTLSLTNSSLKDVLGTIEDNSEFYFLYSSKMIDVDQTINADFKNENIFEILNKLFEGKNIQYIVKDRQILLSPADSDKSSPGTNIPQGGKISGKVLGSEGIPLPGVTVVIKGTTNGTVTNADGYYEINAGADNTLLFSFIGMKSTEIPVGNQKEINVTLEADVIGIEEVVAIGYGTMKKSDLTGSVVRADIDAFKESPNISVVQSLQGSVAGLNVGQITGAGEEPGILIRGKSSISGETAPLIVVDNVIFRGNLIDLNPNDIESVDILKDASSAAIYGSQASNGVILITTTKSGGIEGKPVFNYSNYYSFQAPVKELRPGTPEEFMKKTEESDIYNSRTALSGYLERNPSWEPTSNFKTSDEIAAYNEGRTTDWYSLLTNENMHTQNHNVSLSNSTKYSNYLISLGYTEQLGYMLNEDYNRLNARINIDNTVNDWLKVGIQSFMTLSDYSGQDANSNNRYLSPYATAYDADGELVLITGGNTVNPLIQAEADHLNKRLDFFGNIYALINFPFIKGLTYKLNFANNYRTESEYYFRSYESNFQGEGSKTEKIGYDWSMDNILSFKRTFNDIHNIDITLVYGSEKRKFNSTQAIADVFSTMGLGYNRLQSGSADLQQAISGAWEESSLYTMGRAFYGLKNKYLFTGTIRRDGFSGFSEKNKFGLFPSMSVAWVASEEDFFREKVDWLNQLKVRLSYGSIGNRTIGRYQTLAQVEGDYNYITAAGTPVYTESISSLASPNLKWETTTGINLGIDFAVLSQKISGSVDYYNNNTKDLLYEVDIPGISRFEKFPDNLGRLHNTGLEITINTINIDKADFKWNSSIMYSRNRNELKELLGFDLDGDGKEDDLISEGLFIGQPLDAIYSYKINGKWQINDQIPAGYDLGANKVVDLNNDGTIDANDKTIIGFRQPSYRIGINNTIKYKEWTLRFFINSIQGGKNHYMAEDNLLGFDIMNQENHFNHNFPSGLDYWTPENPDAKYQRPNINVSDGIAGTQYSQRNFIRLQDISLSYNFPRTVINKLKMQNLKLYLSGKNLLTITKWPGWDPEITDSNGNAVKITRNGVPVMKSYTIGLNVEF